MSDGRLLKPTLPVMSLDSTFLQRAFQSGGPSGQLWAAYTEVGRQAGLLAGNTQDKVFLSFSLQVASWTWYYIISGQLSSDYTMSVSELPPSQHTKPKTSFPKSLAFSYTLDGKVQKATVLTDKLSIPACGPTNFQYWVVAPIFSSGWALLGELNKIVTVSETRFFSFTEVGQEYVFLSGVPGETVLVTVYNTNSSQAVVYTCSIGPTGVNMLLIPEGLCKTA